MFDWLPPLFVVPSLISHAASCEKVVWRSRLRALIYNLIERYTNCYSFFYVELGFFFSLLLPGETFESTPSSSMSLLTCCSEQPYLDSNKCAWWWIIGLAPQSYSVMLPTVFHCEKHLVLHLSFLWYLWARIYMYTVYESLHNALLCAGIWFCSRSSLYACRSVYVYGSERRTSHSGYTIFSEKGWEINCYSYSP